MKTEARHAPSDLAVGDAASVLPGDFLCSEPWFPCWNPATHYRVMENGTVSLRCEECASDRNKRLPVEAA